jgi:hypothetical protein
MFIITGMHRSGTSMVSFLVQKMGGDFGPAEELLRADRWNQDGYLENLRFVDINNKLILGLDSDIKYWQNPETSPLKRLAKSIISGKFKYLLFPKSEKFEKRAIQLNSNLVSLARGFRNKFIKDPRFCLTIGSWQSRAEIEGIIFCFRNPVAVKKSVEKRDLMPAFFTNRFWSYHHRVFFESLTADCPVLLVNFDDFFNDRRSRQIEHVESFLVNNCGLRVTSYDADNVIDGSKRHHDGAELLSGAESSIIFNAILKTSRECETGLNGHELKKQLFKHGFPR